MSLSISNNSVSSSVLPKSEGKASVSESDAAESPGFWDKFKDALSPEKSEGDQKVEGSVAKSNTRSQSTDAMLEDAATQAKSSKEDASDEEVSDVKAAKTDKVETAAQSEESEASVKKMTEEAALAGATQVNTEEFADLAAAQSTESKTFENKPSTDKSGINAAKVGADAEQAMSENAELLSRLDESNKALKKPVDAEAEKVAGAAVGVVAAEQAQSSLQNSEQIASSPMDAKPELAGKQAQGSNTVFAASAAGAHASDGKLTQASEAKTALAAEGEGKPQANIAWSQSDAELAAKSEAKAALAGAAIAADKMPPSATSPAGVSLTGAALQTQAQASAQASSAQVPVQGAQAASQPAGEMAAAAAMMAGGKELGGTDATKAGSPMGTHVAGANINGIKGANKAQIPAGLGNDTALQATGALTATQQLRAEQQTPAASAVQSPMVMTKENASDQVAERVQMMMSKNLKHVDIRLDPPELGRMQIRMSLNNDSATVHFTVQNQQTRDMVDQAMPRLREMLSQQGIQLADTSVQQQGQQQRHASHGSGSSGSGNGTSNGGSDVDSFENGTSVEVAVKQNKDGISYYA
ncbi:flagellar hook-length control protein FliK [Vibrio variabilis]|uniref:flagellar hook-length control protein FliK n=1 Tax=Vibrio variabilis TaxID=990271 RepID=UPI000DDA4C74|nr:flagellar hook-length control protein FliK [Vibrio variabilis]